MKKALLDNTLADLLATIQRTTGHGAIYHAIDPGTAPRMNRATCGFCRECMEHPTTARLCHASCISAATHSLNLGGPFYYTCWAGLLFLTMAVAHRDRCSGGLEIGGFIARGEEDQIRSGLTERLPSSARHLQERLLGLFDSLRRISPGELRGLGPFLQEATFSSGVNSPLFFTRRGAHYAQQRAIAEAALSLPKRDPTPEQVFRQAQTLVLQRRRPDITSAGMQRNSARYLAGVLRLCQWDLVRCKAHLRVLIGLVTCDRILEGADWAAATGDELRFLTRLDQAPNLEEACYLVLELLTLQPAITRPDLVSNRPVSERVQQWLQRHYREKVSLAAASQGIGASISSIVQSVRRDHGKSFHKLLVEIRIGESKRLLATTTLELSDIAEMCGYTDQSHFTRELHKAINLTPGHFRKLLKIPLEEVLK